MVGKKKLFSLRNLLVGVALIAVLLGYHQQWVVVQTDAVEVILSNGGRVRYAYTETFSRQSLPMRDFLFPVVEVEEYGSQVEKAIKRLNSVQRINAISSSTIVFTGGRRKRLLQKLFEIERDFPALEV